MLPTGTFSHHQSHNLLYHTSPLRHFPLPIFSSFNISSPHKSWNHGIIESQTSLDWKGAAPKSSSACIPTAQGYPGALAHPSAHRQPRWAGAAQNPVPCPWPMDTARCCSVQAPLQRLGNGVRAGSAAGAAGGSCCTVRTRPSLLHVQRRAAVTPPRSGLAHGADDGRHGSGQPGGLPLSGCEFKACPAALPPCSLSVSDTRVCVSLLGSPASDIALCHSLGRSIQEAKEDLLQVPGLRAALQRAARLSYPHILWCQIPPEPSAQKSE